MLARLTDVVTDPLIGELSDRWRTPVGRRKPWLLIGTPIMLLGVYKLFAPSGDVDIYYFLLWLTIFFLGSTMIMLPHRAWGAEMSTDYTNVRVLPQREILLFGRIDDRRSSAMAVEVMADGGSGVGDVLGKIWTDATGAFTGDYERAHAGEPRHAYRAGSVRIGVDVDMATATGGGDLLLCRERTGGIGHHCKSTMREGIKASAEERPNAAGITHRTVGAFWRVVP